MKPDTKLLNKLVTNIVEAVHPIKIILFGSAARQEMGPNSDLDVLVIMPDGIHRRKTAETIYRHMVGFGFAKDIIVATECDIKKNALNPYMIYKQALDEGQELYNATK